MHLLKGKSSEKEVTKCDFHPNFSSDRFPEDPLLMLWKAIIPQKGGVLIAEIQSVLSSWVELPRRGVICKVVRRDGMPHRLIFWSRQYTWALIYLRNIKNIKNLKNLLCWCWFWTAHHKTSFPLFVLDMLIREWENVNKFVQFNI